MNYVRTVLWMLFAVVATYTAAEGMLAYKKTVEQDGASAGAREVTPKASTCSYWLSKRKKNR
jgi:hypothetical protein